MIGLMMNKENEDKTYNYIVLIIGLLIWLIYFYQGRDTFLTTRLYDTQYDYFFGNFSWEIREIFNHMFTWLLLQGLFIYSWWSLRQCITSVLKKIHRNI